jgi:hypothetical protein
MATIGRVAQVKDQFQKEVFIPLLEQALAEGRITPAYVPFLEEGLRLLNDDRVKDKNGKPVSAYASELLVMVALAMGIGEPEEAPEPVPVWVEAEAPAAEVDTSDSPATLEEALARMGLVIDHERLPEPRRTITDDQLWSALVGTGILDEEEEG